MLWTIAAPFFTAAPPDNRWLDDLIDSCTHRFRKVERRDPGADGWHDRAGRATPLADWAGHWKQSAAALAQGEGLVTIFPQLALTAAIQRRWRGRGRPIVAWCFNIGRFPTGARAAAARPLLRLIDQFVVHSRGEVDLLREWLDLDGDRVSYVPLQRAAIPVLAEEETRHPFLLAMGSANRDYATLFDACALTRLPVTIVAARHALPDRTPPPNVRIVHGLSAEDCLVLAQRARASIVPLAAISSASGQVTLVEAMRMGRPLIATDTMGTRDYVTDGDTALVVPPGDSDALATAMEKLWDDAPLRLRLGRAAYDLAARTLSDEAAASALERILDHVLARTGPRAAR